jgi:peroxiredoxin
MAVQVGDAAPEFELRDASAKPVRLSDFRGEKNVVLAFYVLAMTAGCRNELIAFRDLNADFVKADTQVLGISVDTFPSIGVFANSLDLNFPLLSDFPENKATKTYGTYNPEYGTSNRRTYVVDKAGIIRAEIVSDDDMSRHAEDALRTVREIEGLEQTPTP